MKSIRIQRNETALGFTLVELMIAMTITLLLMAALGKSFAVIGATMKEGRSQVLLSSKVRGLSYNLRSRLELKTVQAKPPIKSASGQGYFMYYEGPLTQHTFGLYGAEPTQTTPAGAVVSFGDPAYGSVDNSPTYRRHSRIGDFDDYLAFTAEASDGDWFTGKVPAYLVDDTAADPMEPRIIRSKYAEIIVWASPKWAIDETSNSLQVAPHPSGMPVYADQNNDFVPDDIVLHQRVLLIRPDLNSKLTVPGGNARLAFEGDVLRPMGGVLTPGTVPAALSGIYPIGSSLFPSYADPASETDNRAMLTSNWLVGMAPLHHFFDLSLRRVVHPLTGDPTNYVAANSLSDLTQPHNRFAHVRYPGRYFGRGVFGNTTPAADNATSMPLLAVGWNDAVLNWQTNDPRGTTATAPAWFPSSPTSSRALNLASGEPVGLFNGWLLPHFELGDPNPVAVGNLSQWQRGYLSAPDFRWDRTGEDVIASNVLSFDIKGFDRTAPVFVTTGPDGQPGFAGVDDDQVGGADNIGVVAGQISSEMGATGSDDVLVRVGDLSIAAVVAENILNPAATPPVIASATSPMLVNQGDFVDLAYPSLAGSPLLGQLNNTTAPIQGNFGAYFQSELSMYPTTLTGLDALKRSGKLLHARNGAAILNVFFQPTFDTWTDAYESDGFDQSHTLDGSISAAGTAADPYLGSTWIQYNDANNIAGRDARLPTPAAPPVALSIDSGRMMPTNPETLPPITSDLPAISITIRVGDPQSQEMTEFTVIEPLL